MLKTATEFFADYLRADSVRVVGVPNDVQLTVLTVEPTGDVA